MTLRINATYAQSAVGTGTYTRNIMRVLPEARPWTLPAVLTRGHPVAFWTRRIAEESSSWLSGTTIHPYWCTSSARSDIVSVLDFVQYREATAVERSLLRRATRRARNVLALSATVAEEIDADLGRRGVIAPPFPDPEWYIPAPGKQVPRKGRIRIVYWGGVHARKGISEFLLATSRSDMAADVEVYCPRDTPHVPGLRLHRYGDLTSKALVRLVDSCDLSVYPSSEEGFGLPVFESLLRGLPVISKPLPVYEEFAMPSSARVHVKSDEPDEVSQAIRDAVQPHRLTPKMLLWRPTQRQALASLTQAIAEAMAP